MNNSIQFNAVSSSTARQTIESATQKPMGRAVFSKIFALMVEHGHAERAERNGMCGLVSLEALRLWVQYVQKRENNIKSGKWATNRPYSIDDFREATGG